MLFFLPLLAVGATVSPQTMIPNPAAFVMSIDETGRAVCSGPTEQQRIMILDHIERHRIESVPDLDVDYLLDSSENVTLNFRGVPRAAREAIWYAMDLWYEQLEITVSFTVTVYWETLEEDEDSGVSPLGFATAVGQWWCWERLDWGCLPRPLANQRAGHRVVNETEFEVHLNSEANWHMGTDGRTGRLQHDLVTLMLHEIGHGLGFSSAFGIDHDSKTGKNWWDEIKFSKYYDHFVWSRGEGDLMDLISPSRDLWNALTGNRLFWGRSSMENWHGESLLSIRRNGGPVMLWASNMTAWGALVSSGQVVSHLDADAFTESHRDGLMNPFLSRGRANHRIGPVTLGILYDLGWILNGYRRPTSPPPPTPPPPPKPDFNPDAAEAWALLRMIGSEEGNRTTPHFGILLHATGGSHGLFGVDSEAEYDSSIRLLHSEPIHSRSSTIHMKADNRWVPHLVISEKNQAAEGFEDAGLEYSTTVDLTGSDFQNFLRTRDQIELHIHFSGDTRRTVLTFPLREPINRPIHLNETGFSVILK